MEEVQIRISDKRKGVFTVDNVVLNHYGQAMGATGIALYVTLCRYANNQNQTCWPSIATIAQETDMNRKTIMKTMEKLEQLQLIQKQRGNGGVNHYTLLEPYDEGMMKDLILKRYYEWLSTTSTKIGTGTKIGTTPVPKLVLPPVPIKGHERTNKNELKNELITTPYNPPMEKEGTTNISRDIQEVMDFWENTLDTKLPRNKGMSFFPLRDLVAHHGKEKVMGAIIVVGQNVGTKFFPTINHPRDLENKWVQIMKSVFTNRIMEASK